ncbi:MAG: MtrB/PioB family decaheme-associated outer membrane protein [Acidobacteriota bacterium]
MRKLLNLILIFGIIFGLSILPVSAEEKEKEEVKVKGRAVTGAEDIQTDAKSSKYYEYRDVPRGFYFNLFDLTVERGDRYLNFYANRIRQKDGKYGFSLGDYGKYNVDFEWDKIPHRFSFEGKTLYGELKPGVYTLSDQIQLDAQNAVGDGGLNALRYIGKARTLISDFLTGAHDVGLGLIRNKGTLDLTYNPSVPLSINFNASREARKGTRPIGASFGFSHVVEVQEPIDYNTTNVDANLEYSKQWGTLRAGYYASTFENDIQTLIWDNPYRITDQSYHAPVGAYVWGNGSVRGQMALMPSNSAQKFYINSSFKLLKSTRLNGSISYGSFSQNEKLLPYTINTAIVHEYSGALNSPADTANAKANITSMDFTLISKIIKNVYLNAGYRYYNFDNQTHELHLPGYSRFDQVWEEVPVSVEPYKFVQSRYFGDLSFNLIKNTSFKVGYSFYSIERKLGEEDEGKSDEGTLKASIDSNLTDWLLLRVSYLSAKREWSLEGKKDLYLLRLPGSFNFRRYHEANRDREGINFLVGISPIKNLDFSASYMSGKDKYPKSDYGLKTDDFSLYSFDLSYSIGANSAIYGFYSREEYKGYQGARQTANPPYDKISASTLNDWFATLKDTVDTFGGGLNTYLKKDKINFDLSYTYSKADGTSDLYSPPGREGTGPDLAANFTKKIDTTTLQTIRARLLWKLRPRFSVALGYWYEQYDLEDITRNDWKVDMLATGYALYLGALEPAYKYHVAFLTFICSW